jgi:hypothetical protein
VNLHEELFVKSFIVPAKRERYLSFLSNDKHRRKLLDNLDHLYDLNKTKVIDILPDQQTAQSICRLMREKGGGENCYVISTNWELDGKELSLREALEGIVGSGFGSYVSCIAGKLGYYEGEKAGERYILVV